MALINPKWRKDAGDNSVNAVARVGGVGIAAYVIEQIQNPKNSQTPSNIRDTMIKISAPGIALLGVAGDLFFSHPVLRAFCQGLYSYAVPRSVANFSKDLSEAMGWNPLPEFNTNGGNVSGIGNPAIMNGVNPAIMNGVGNPRVVTYTPRPAVQAARPATAAPAVNSEQSIRGLAEAMLINN